MWKAIPEFLEGRRIQRYRPERDGERVSWSETLEAWQQDAGFRMFFVGLLSDAPFKTYFWETPPVTVGRLDDPFEFVLLDAPSLHGVRPEPEAFREHFDAAGEPEAVVVFANLGRDATLVAPCPQIDSSAYPHLAAFSRHGSTSQNHALWRAVGRTLSEHVSDRPVWLSTAGTGVFWLHMRLDSRPKYYSHTPYRNAS